MARREPRGSRRGNARCSPPRPAHSPPAFPPIDDIGAPIDELAFVLATDHLTTVEKVRMLEQWRYDELLMQNGATEGLDASAPTACFSSRSAGRSCGSTAAATERGQGPNAAPASRGSGRSFCKILG